MARLDDYRVEEATVDGDQFWVCIDSDHWIKPNHIDNLVQVARECRQKGYGVAVSNPCFELWLLLHFRDFQVSDVPCRCGEVEKQLRLVIGGYRKDNITALPLTVGGVQLAIERALKLDTDDQVLPKKPATRVYKLLEVLLQRESIDLHTPQV